MGLNPVNGSYFQPYNLLTMSLAEGNLLQVINSENDRMLLRPGQDYYPQNFSGSGQIRGSLVYAGFGITAPDLGYDDYRGIDVRGKIVLVLDHEPSEADPASPFEGVVTAEEANALRKALNAQAKGAIGILYVADVHNHPQQGNFESAARNAWPAEPPRIRRFTLQSWVEKVRIPGRADLSGARVDPDSRNEQNACRTFEVGGNPERNHAGGDSRISRRTDDMGESARHCGSQRGWNNRGIRSSHEGRVRHRVRPL